MVVTDLKAENAGYQVGSGERQGEAWFMLQNHYKAQEGTVQAMPNTGDQLKIY